MSEEPDPAIPALLEKRAAIATQIQEAQASLHSVDATLKLLGYVPGRKTRRRFANGELIRLIGEAERAGMATPHAIAKWVIQKKEWDPADRTLATRVRFSVKDCRKRMNKAGV